VTLRAHTLRLLLAFAAVYLVWGSTYLGMKIAVATLPPFVLGAIRFTLAGAALLAVQAVMGRVQLRWLGTWAYWRSAALTGGLMLVGANGLLAYSLRAIPTGTAALIVAITPVWLVVLDRMQMKRGSPPRRVIVGLILGAAGVAVLAGFGEQSLRPSLAETIGIGIALFSTLCWALGSILGRRTPQPSSLMVGAAMQMVAGGALMALIAVAMLPWTPVDWSGLSWHEWWAAAWGPVTRREWVAVAYLAIAGSMIGFSAYVWLLQNTTAARAGTYAYVNPLVALLLGWLVLDERPSARIAIAGPLILLGVVLLQWHRREAATTVAESAGVVRPRSTSRPDDER